MPYDQTNRERGLERDSRKSFSPCRYCLHAAVSFEWSMLITHLSIRSKRITRKVNNRQKSSLSQVIPKKISVSIHFPSFEDAASAKFVDKLSNSFTGFVHGFFFWGVGVVLFGLNLRRIGLVFACLGGLGWNRFPKTSPFCSGIGQRISE